MKHRNADPPDEPEHPECCGELMDIDGQVCRCSICGHCIELSCDPPDWCPELEGELPERPDGILEGPLD